MGFLKGYVGIKNVVVNPASGRYLNELPGISFRQLEGIKDVDAIDLHETWEDIERNAIDHFLLDLKASVSVKTPVRDVLSHSKTVSFSEKKLDASVWHTVREFSFSNRLHYGVLKVDSLRVRSEVFGNVVVRITVDGISEELEPQGVTAAGTTITLNSEYRSSEVGKVLIEVNADVALYGTEEKHASPCYYLPSCYPKQGNAGQIKYTLSCDFEAYLQDSSYSVLTPFMHRLALEFLKERIGSDRVNHFTLLNVNKAEELYERYMDEYRGMLKKTTLNPTDCLCFGKAQMTVSIRNVLP